MALSLKTEQATVSERVDTIHVIDADINAHFAHCWTQHPRAGERQKQAFVEAKRIYLAISGNEWEPKAQTSFIEGVAGAVRGWYHTNNFEVFSEYTWGEA